MVDLGALEEIASLSGLARLHLLTLRMLEADTHGMGGGAEADALFAIEDPVIGGAKDAGMRYLGRLRTRGTWQLAFMGGEEHAGTLDALAALATRDGERDYDVEVRDDPEWSHYREFLYPDAERMQWIQDRRVVEALQGHGDSLEAPRRVQHWVYLPDAEARAFLMADAREAGFEAAELESPGEGGEGGDSGQFGCVLARVDSVLLDEIHEVVMWLCALAEQHGGSYDGWETSVEHAKKGGGFLSRLFGRRSGAS